MSGVIIWGFAIVGTVWGQEGGVFPGTTNLAKHRSEVDKYKAARNLLHFISRPFSTTVENFNDIYKQLLTRILLTNYTTALNHFTKKNFTCRPHSFSIFFQKGLIYYYHPFLTFWKNSGKNLPLYELLWKQLMYFLEQDWSFDHFALKRNGLPVVSITFH